MDRIRKDERDWWARAYFEMQLRCAALGVRRPYTGLRSFALASYSLVQSDKQARNRRKGTILCHLSREKRIRNKVNFSSSVAYSQVHKLVIEKRVLVTLAKK